MWARAGWRGGLAVGSGLAAAGRVGAAAPEIPQALQELWQERAAIIAADGHVPPAEAERLAWACLCPHDAGPVRAGSGPDAVGELQREERRVLRLEDLKSGARITGILPNATVILA